MEYILISFKQNLMEANLEAATILLNDHKEEFTNNLFDVISNITVHLNANVKKENPALFNCCDKILNVVTSEFEPEEVLLQFIDDIAKTNDDTTFVTLLTPLRHVLLKLPQRRLNSLGWGLNCVNSYLNGIPIRDDQCDENNYGDDDNFVDADQITERVLFLYEKTVPFYTSLIEEFNLNTCESQERTIIILKFILQLLGKPLTVLDLQTCSTGRKFAETIIQHIFNISSDIFWIAELQNRSAVYDIGSFDDLSLATLYYLILAQGIFLRKIPRVYDPVYIFHNRLYLATVLLSCKIQPVIYKGLCLLQALLTYVNGFILCYELLDSENHSRFCKTITAVIIYNDLEEHRKKGLQLFRKYLFQFDTRGRFLLVYNLTKTLNHSGIVSYIINVYKDMLMQEMNKSKPLSTYFKEQNLFTILNLFCYIPTLEDSDVLDFAEQIVGVLNLLRFLAIRDKDNTTKIWDYFKTLENQYLEPIKKSIGLAKIYYELSINRIEQRRRAKAAKISVTVAGRAINQLSKQDKLKVMHSAITSCDVIESLLSRVNELIQVNFVK